MLSIALCLSCISGKRIIGTIIYNGFPVASANGRTTHQASLYNIAQSLSDNDYYIKAIKALHGVFMYQRLSRPPVSLYGVDSKTQRPHLDIIADLLRPASEMGAGKANRMIYCLATDYLALVHHKKATKAMGAIIGQEREYYLDNSGDFELLKSLLSNKEKAKEKAADLRDAVKHFSATAKLLDDVGKCQNALQGKEDNEGFRYIWASYALYNQARCEFMIHLIESLSIAVKPSKFVDGEDSLLASRWHTDMRAAVDSRQVDYTYFCDRKLVPGFPGFITFNLQAEYYHAFYEYELSSLVEMKINPGYRPKPFANYQKFQDWKDANLTITDVLSVDGKVARLSKLKEAYVDEEIALLLSGISDEDTRKKIAEILKPLKNAAVAEDEDAYDRANAKIAKEVEIEGKVGVEYIVGLIPKLTGELRGKFFYSKKTS